MSQFHCHTSNCPAGLPFFYIITCCGKENGGFFYTFSVNATHNGKHPIIKEQWKHTTTQNNEYT